MADGGTLFQSSLRPCQRLRPEAIERPCRGLPPRAGRLVMLEMTPLQIRHMRLNLTTPTDAEWICDTVNTISHGFGTHVSLTERGALHLRPHHA